MTLTTLRHSAMQQLKRWYSSETLASPQLRKLGFIYSIYRFLVSGFLMVTTYASLKNSSHNVLPTLLQQTALSFYVLLSLILLGLLYTTPARPQRQLGFGLAIDVIILSLLLYTSGAPDLQLTMLYMVVVAASFMLLRAPQALVITLMAIIFVIYQQFFFVIANSMSLSNFGDALLMSASFLAVGFLSWSISQRLVQVESVAALQAQEVARLNAINQEVISKMVSGVMVIDHQQVVLINQAACSLLNINPHFDEENSLELLQHQLLSLHPQLCEWFISIQGDTGQSADQSNDNTDTNVDVDVDVAHNNSRTHPSSEDSSNSNSNSSADPTRLNPVYPFTYIYELPSFASTSVIDKLRVELTPLKNHSQLLILEDLRREQASAQQLKLASLGQLTASIAHEIRNPLATISQASQLLIEDAEVSDSNAELYQMIFTQTKRVNRIIEDVLKLSRQQKPKRQAIDIAHWLRQFLVDHFGSHDVFLDIRSMPIISFDPHQLEQILINLINNGLRYSSRAQPHAYVEVMVYSSGNDAIIDIMDEGQGVAAKDLPRLFDPFFTTDIEGTGLGLYLSQAFSEANHARLLYVPDHPKTCFRLIIPLSARQIPSPELTSRYPSDRD